MTQPAQVLVVLGHPLLDRILVGPGVDEPPHRFGRLLAEQGKFEPPALDATKHTRHES